MGWAAAFRTVFWVSVGAVCYTYLAYPALMWALARAKALFAGAAPEPSPRVAFEPRVSVLVAAYNEEAVIARKVENFLALDYPPQKLELLIGSDGSNDATVALARGALPPGRGRVCDYARRGKVWVLNDLAREAAGEVVVFTDANTYFDRDALRKLVVPLADPAVGCASGLLRLKPTGTHAGAGGEGFYWRYETFKKLQENAFRAVAGANGAIFAIRKDLFVPLSPLTINDDLTTSMRVYLQGRRLVLVPDANAHEETAPTLGGEFQRHVRDSAGHFRAMIELRGLFNPFLGMPSFCFVSHRIVRWLVPFFMLAALASAGLLFRSPVYRALFFLQAGVYAACLGITPYALGGGRLGVLRVPYYFVFVNVAILCGFQRFLRGSQRSAWVPTARA